MLYYKSYLFTQSKIMTTGNTTEKATDQLLIDINYGILNWSNNNGLNDMSQKLSM